MKAMDGPGDTAGAAGEPEADALLKEALALHQAGRVREAEDIYRRILAAHPEHPKANHFYGVTALQGGNPAAAAEYIAKAIRLDPRDASFRNNLGTALTELGKLDEAAASFEEALSLDPSSAMAHHLLGEARLKQENFAEAASLASRAISLNPEYAEAHNNLGIALQAQGQIAQARTAFQRALAIQPNYAAAHSNLGNLFQERENLSEAEAAFRKAISIRPSSPITHNNLGNTLYKQGRLAEAVASYERALALDPEYKNAAYNLSISLLLMGDLPAGWRRYESRWESPFYRGERKSFPQPRWDGSPLEGKTLFLHCEQGIGDTLQMVRYARPIADLGGKLILECQGGLKSLLDTMPWFDSVIAEGEARPAFDLQAPLMSLPHILGTTIETIPGEVPYLWPPENPEISAAVSAPPGAPRIGLVWAGNPEHHNDRNRSVPLEKFGPLLRMENVRFFSLQVGATAKQIGELGLEDRLIDLGGRLTDFSVTASAAGRLDLLITVDTATAHLTGAMGKPVWTLLPFVPDWRWLMEREDTPWYPSMRLFRQKTIGDWDTVVREVKENLAQWRP
jgi:Flp pilus assembly protein TadD